MKVPVVAAAHDGKQTNLGGVTLAGRGPQTFQKRQKEQQRKEKQLEKIAKRLQRKQNPLSTQQDDDDTGILDADGLDAGTLDTGTPDTGTLDPRTNPE